GLPQGKVDIRPSSSAFRGLSLARVEHNGVVQREGIEVRQGEQVNGVRIVMVYGTLSLGGEVKYVGGELPKGHRLVGVSSPTDQSMRITKSGEVDKLGKFVIENLTAGEYELSVFPSFTPTTEMLDRQTRDALSSFREKLTISGDNHPPVTIVIDFNRK